MEKILFSTRNEDKIKEASQILKDLELESLGSAGLSLDVVEDQDTYEGNAEKKAIEAMKLSGMPALADDSGLEIDFLGGEPGVWSARYMGGATQKEKNQAILDKLKGVPDSGRGARFICAVVVVFPDGTVYRSRGVMEGRIAHEAKGDNGFGYDPIFYVPEKGKTVSELSAKEKHELSHRGKALRGIRDALAKGLEK
ncbi:MAG: RdgB/HAM1 family non-canonical purine NTP pyrophosphatase [Clostridiales bacterium]|jgi:XTP/dITP diphosphohydrolase|nr:RdgB/HAM1 family non-canonical purine NTP pyrophosphatase [Clostridiales bacterium]